MTTLTAEVPVSIDLMMKWNRPIPRYTSYPTAPEWGALAESDYIDQLHKLKASDDPISLYIHVPFCQSMCLYCGCSVILNRRPENEERYVSYLMREMDLVARQLDGKRRVTQLHFGGGTPTKLSEEQMERLFQHIGKRFDLDMDGELSMEIDPRTVLANDGSKLRHLRQLGFNRVSFGVQDTNEKVQDAVRRRQSLEMTQATYYLARELGFQGINIDLIYGLPHQTVETFSQTAHDILELRPDRLALFSYAKVPWLKPHQNAIKDDTLPSTDEKFSIYAKARQELVQGGYVAVGMDHFALEQDEIAQAYLNGRLHRNFQGYAVKCADHLVSFGVTSIGDVADAYFQNIKELIPYYQSIDAGCLPIQKGKILSEEDKMRRWVINQIMCQFKLDKALFHERYGKSFDETFAAERADLEELKKDGFVIDGDEALQVTPIGELFVRNIACQFDAYLRQNKGLPMFSKSV